MTETLSSSKLAVYIMLVFGLTTILFGPSPSPTVTLPAITSFVVPFMTETLSSSLLAVYIMLVFGLTATAYGQLPTGISPAIISFVVPFIEERDESVRLP